MTSPAIVAFVGRVATFAEIADRLVDRVFDRLVDIVLTELASELTEVCSAARAEPVATSATVKLVTVVTVEVDPDAVVPVPVRMTCQGPRAADEGRAQLHQ